MDSKPWWQSKAIIGALLMVIVVIIRAIGKESEAEAIEAESEGIVEWILQAGTLVAALLAFWGRLTAKKDIRL